MAVSDPVADLLTRIRNGLNAKNRYIDVSWSKLKQSICEILKENGFVENFITQVDEKKRGKIRVFLKYSYGPKPVIQGLKRVSKPGLRKYVGHKDIPYFFGGFGVPILSTPKGLMAGNDARKNKVGGELLCLVW